jgi:hypothetical protein
MFSAIILHISVVQAKTPALNTEQSISNVMIFGDSLSDIGNGPSSLTFDGDDTGSGYFTNTYVPISNPVNPDADHILPGTGLLFPPTDGNSKLYQATLPPQLLLCTDGTCVDREFRSLNWVEYFVYNAALRKLMAPGVDLRPWVIQHNENDVNLSQSVNYAFYSGMSGKGCVNWDLDTVDCRVTVEGVELPLEASVFLKQLEYREEQSETDIPLNKALRKGVITPSLRKQIEMFKHDKELGRVKVNNSTGYFVYTGANDISEAFFSFIDGDSTFEEFLLALTVKIPGEIADKKDPESGVSQLIKHEAKIIRVLGQYNLGYSPEVLTEAGVDTLVELHGVAAALDVLITMYNDSLKHFINEQKDQGLVDVEYVDIQKPMRDVANRLISLQPEINEGYFFSIGQRCVEPTAELIDAGLSASCFSQEMGPPIGFWNDAHLSTQYYQIIASAVLDELGGKTMPEHGSDSDMTLEDVEDLFTRLFRDGD